MEADCDETCTHTVNPSGDSGSLFAVSVSVMNVLGFGNASSTIPYSKFTHIRMCQ